jgi:hypothetical protein
MNQEKENIPDENHSNGFDAVTDPHNEVLPCPRRHWFTLGPWEDAPGQMFPSDLIKSLEVPCEFFPDAVYLGSGTMAVEFVRVGDRVYLDPETLPAGSKGGALLYVGENVSPSFLVESPFPSAEVLLALALADG